MEKLTFEQELTELINRHSKENDSNTPDFILAEYMRDSLKAFNVAACKREVYYGRSVCVSVTDMGDPKQTERSGKSSSVFVAAPLRCF